MGLSEPPCRISRWQVLVLSYHSNRHTHGRPTALHGRPAAKAVSKKVTGANQRERHKESRESRLTDTRKRLVLDPVRRTQFQKSQTGTWKLIIFTSPCTNGSTQYNSTEKTNNLTKRNKYRKGYLTLFKKLCYFQ